MLGCEKRFETNSSAWQGCLSFSSCSPLAPGYFVESEMHTLTLYAPGLPPASWLGNSKMLLVSELQVSRLSHAYSFRSLKSFHIGYSPYSSSSVCGSVTTSFQPVPQTGSVRWSLISATVMPTPLI